MGILSEIPGSEKIGDVFLSPRTICAQRGRRPEVIFVVIGQFSERGRDQSVILKSNWFLTNQSYATPAFPLGEIMVYYKRGSVHKL